MIENIQLHLAKPLLTFIEDQIRELGVCGSVNDYIQDLVRKEYDRTEAAKWRELEKELDAGMKSLETGYVVFDPAEIKGEARKIRDAQSL